MTAGSSRYRFPDPYDEFTDAEFEREVWEALDESTIKISLRMPKSLLERTKQVASERGVPYQALMKAVLDRGIQRLERKRAPTPPGKTSRP